MISHVSAVPAQRTRGVPAGGAVGGAAGDVGAVPAVSAVERYKELVGLAAESVDRVRARDRDRVRELIAGLAASQERVVEVIEREKLVRAVVRVHWEAVVELLWEERWMTMTPVPAPDESVPPRPQEEYDAAMNRAFEALEESLQRRTLLRRKSA
ncbi:hypothetical protein ACFFSW_12065 [Saccharothrix longispora]|uniref:Uncharacterized protein n=1 Tax=Saccharothrix longispora TaxID=33920 RepID=A0ABU1Q725_9PSEU|nr:hypothetical protein [Saccharothrix longispora]MDR6597929.1 hypothetical protein [Saccharothrix longispora]